MGKVANGARGASIQPKEEPLAPAALKRSCRQRAEAPGVPSMHAYGCIKHACVGLRLRLGLVGFTCPDQPSQKVMLGALKRGLVQGVPGVPSMHRGYQACIWGGGVSRDIQQRAVVAQDTRVVGVGRKRHLVDQGCGVGSAKSSRAQSHSQHSICTAQSQHMYSTCTAQSQHMHSTVTAPYRSRLRHRCRVDRTSAGCRDCAACRCGRG